MATDQFEGTRELFNLPADEMIYESVECASGDNLSYKGRLYISENFISFSCNMIGMVKKFSIRIQDITDIKLVTPSTLRITSFNGKSQVIGNFGKYKEKVMKLIGSLYQKEFDNDDSDLEDEGKLSKNTTNEQILKDDTLMVYHI